MDKKIEKKKEKKTIKQSEKADTKDKKIEELTNDLKRVQADFSNYCKRTDKDKKEFAEYASALFICKVLPIIDELEIALNKINNADDKKGIQIILDKLKKTLSEEGVKEINCNDKKFDPFKHEAVLFEDSNEDGIILEEIQKGYEMKGKILRYSKVKVSRLSKESIQGSKENLEGDKK
ncbi:nucleotide exchange factor GrpE [Candidatus Woesearchaeota archaeon]|nr:nucleotide exchange factor GrpE [Candidatus Woesearchaeota archaeon]